MERKQWDAISHRIVAVWWKCCERGYLIRSSISLISSAGISADCLLEGTRRLLSRETGAWERCWIMSSGVLGCVYVYRCILHFDYQKHRISWIKVLKNLIMHYNTSKLGPRLCCWDGTLYRIKWDSFSLQTWVGLRDQAENGSSTGHPWWMVTERNASRKWKCCKTVSKGDDAVKSEVEQGYALDQAMISIFSIFRSKAGVKLTFYWWLILLRCCLSVAATLQISSQWRSCGKKYKAGRNWLPPK